ncbi:MAG: branched-chain amino acid ABC transporter permease [Geminicoccaceae bacterium]
MIEFINFHLIPGIVLGSIYALGAIGVTLTFGILRFANFAHGEVMTFGVYVTLTLLGMANSYPFDSWLGGIHPLALLPISMAITSVVVLNIDRVFYKPLRASPTIILVMASFGMMLMLRSVTQFSWGVQLQSFQPGIQRPWVLFDALRISPKHITIVIAALLLMAAVHYLLTRTKIGKAMRAMADSPELARLTGIETERVIKATWILGASLAAAAGVFLAIDTHVETMMGFKLLLPIFASVILGGVGSPYGAMVGGLVIGIVEEISTYPWIGDAPLISPGYKAGVAFALMVIMLIWRPSGLLRGRVF